MGVTMASGGGGVAVLALAKASGSCGAGDVCVRLCTRVCMCCTTQGCHGQLLVQAACVEHAPLPLCWVHAGACERVCAHERVRACPCVPAFVCARKSVHTWGLFWVGGLGGLCMCADCRVGSIIAETVALAGGRGGGHRTVYRFLMCQHPDWGAAQGEVGIFNLLSFLLLSLPQALPLTLVIRVRSITHLQGGECPWGGSGCQGSAGQHHQVPAPIWEGTTRTPGRAASRIALELALAVPCASAAPAARPWVRPMSPPLKPWHPAACRWLHCGAGGSSPVTDNRLIVGPSARTGGMAPSGPYLHWLLAPAWLAVPLLPLQHPA